MHTILISLNNRQSTPRFLSVIKLYWCSKFRLPGYTFAGQIQSHISCALKTRAIFRKISTDFNYCWGQQIFNESPYRIIAIACAYNHRTAMVRTKIVVDECVYRFLVTSAPMDAWTLIVTSKNNTLASTPTKSVCVCTIVQSKNVGWKLFIIGILCIEFCDLMWYFGVHNLSTHRNSVADPKTHPTNRMWLWLIY